MKARLPMDYDNYVFDLYGTLVDIRTDENRKELWKSLSLFYSYYGACYEPLELKEAYGSLVSGKEKALKMTLEEDKRYAHEASPEIQIQEVFEELFTQKGVSCEKSLSLHAGQMFRAMSTEYVRLYDGAKEMLSYLKSQGKKVYLLSNAQQIFTGYELRTLGILELFDDVMISSDYNTKKPDKRFFDILVQKHGIKVEKSIYVGNDSKNDVLGAKTVGMDTFYVFSNISPENDRKDLADYNVSDFSEWDYK